MQAEERRKAKEIKTTMPVHNAEIAAMFDEAAELLEINRTTLSNKLRKYGLGTRVQQEARPAGVDRTDRDKGL